MSSTFSTFYCHLLLNHWPWIHQVRNNVPRINHLSPNPNKIQLHLLQNHQLLTLLFLKHRPGIHHLKVSFQSQSVVDQSNLHVDRLQCSFFQLFFSMFRSHLQLAHHPHTRSLQICKPWIYTPSFPYRQLSWLSLAVHDQAELKSRRLSHRSLVHH